MQFQLTSLLASLLTSLITSLLLWDQSHRIFCFFVSVFTYCGRICLNVHYMPLTYPFSTKKNVQMTWSSPMGCASDVPYRQAMKHTDVITFILYQGKFFTIKTSKCFPSAFVTFKVIWQFLYKLWCTCRTYSTVGKEGWTYLPCKVVCQGFNV